VRVCMCLPVLSEYIPIVSRWSKCARQCTSDGWLVTHTVLSQSQSTSLFKVVCNDGGRLQEIRQDWNMLKECSQKITCDDGRSLNEFHMLWFQATVNQVG
jgi:hypothetical protein